jgi:hypothetical protein
MIPAPAITTGSAGIPPEPSPKETAFAGYAKEVIAHAALVNYLPIVAPLVPGGNP